MRTHTRSAFTLALALCLLVSAAACMRFQRQPVDKRYYALEVQRPAAAPVQTAPLRAETLLVRRLSASPRIAGRELVYRTAPSAWTADFYNLFFVSPADMLTQDLRSWLGVSGLFANVVDPASLAPSSYTLEGNVISLYGDLAEKPGQGVAEIQFMLLRTDGAERTVVLTRNYRRSVALAANTPQALADALREAVAGIYADLEADLRRTLASAK
jgi:cholesterol transport system auxiliary component